MTMTRPEARETTGTLRETSGATIPVTTSSEVVDLETAAASGYCSGWSTVNRLASAPGTTMAGGGASAASSPCTLLQPPRVASDAMNMKRTPILKRLLFISGTLPRPKPWDVFQPSRFQLLRRRQAEAGLRRA